MGSALGGEKKCDEEMRNLLILLEDAIRCMAPSVTTVTALRISLDDGGQDWFGLLVPRHPYSSDLGACRRL